MAETDIRTLLTKALDLLARDGAPSTFDFESALLKLGASPAEATLLADYIPSACGRAFCRELGMIPTDAYQRRNKDGSWDPSKRLADDATWRNVESFVEILRIHSRRQFSLAAQHSSEVHAISNVVDGGETLTDLRGVQVATVFYSPPK